MQINLDKLSISLMFLMPLIIIINPVVSIGKVRLPDLILVVLYGILMIKKTKGRNVTAALVLLCISALWFSLSLISPLFFSGDSPDLARNIRFWLNLLWLPVIILLMGSNKIIYLNYLIIGTTSMAVSSLIMYFTNPAYQRIAGFFSSADGEGLNRQASYNEWGALFSIGLIAIFFLILKSFNRWYILLFLLNFAGLVLTQSRSALFGLVAGVLVLTLSHIYSLFKAKEKVIRGIVILLALPVVPYIYTLAVSGLAVNRISDSFEYGSNAFVSAVVRFDMWRSALDIWDQNVISLLLGVGVSDFRLMMGGDTSDNFYLDHLALYGLIPFFLLGLYVSIALIKSKDYILSLSILVAGLIISITGNVLSDPILGPCFLMSLVSLGTRKVRDVEIKALSTSFNYSN